MTFIHHCLLLRMISDPNCLKGLDSIHCMFQIFWSHILLLSWAHPRADISFILIRFIQMSPFVLGHNTFNNNNPFLQSPWWPLRNLCFPCLISESNNKSESAKCKERGNPSNSLPSIPFYSFLSSCVTRLLSGGRCYDIEISVCSRSFKQIPPVVWFRFGAFSLIRS